MDATLVQENKLTDAGLAEVKRRLPHADLTELEKSRDIALVPGPVRRAGHRGLPGAEVRLKRQRF